MSNDSNEFLARAQSERAIVLPLVCLLIAGLLGLVALAVDIGAHYLTIQRQSAVIDLAALSASDLHMRGASAAEVRNHIQYLVNANDSFNAAGPVEWPQDQELEIDIFGDMSEGSVAVNRKMPLRTYFSGVFGGGASHASDITSAAAYDLTPTADEPVHLVLLLDSSAFTESVYGDGCTEGVTGIPCLNQEDETEYCPSACASRLDVENEHACCARSIISGDKVQHAIAIKVAR